MEIASGLESQGIYWLLSLEHNTVTFGADPKTVHFVQVLYNFNRFVGHRSQTPLTATDFGTGHRSQALLTKPFLYSKNAD